MRTARRKLPEPERPAHNCTVCGRNGVELTPAQFIAEPNELTHTAHGLPRWKGTVDLACGRCRKHLNNREPTYLESAKTSDDLRHHVNTSQLEPMLRVLTLREPYAWLVVNGFKDVENRTWLSHYTGRVLIHSAKVVDEHFDRVANYAGTHFGIVVPDREELEVNNCGRLVGVAHFGKMFKPLESPWYQPGKWAWPISWAFAVHPGPVIRGKQGFWFLDRDHLVKLFYEQ